MLFLQLVNKETAKVPGIYSSAVCIFLLKTELKSLEDGKELRGKQKIWKILDFFSDFRVFFFIFFWGGGVSLRQ